MTIEDKCDLCDIWIMISPDATRKLKEKFDSVDIEGVYLAPVTNKPTHVCGHMYELDSQLYCNYAAAIFDKMRNMYGYDDG